MLAIRMQRTGRRGHAMFRVIVQDSRLTPTSGKVVAGLGSYDPHAKALVLDKDKAKFYLDHGAQPSERVARLLKKEGVKLPGWVKLSADKERAVRNAAKRRSTRTDEPAAPAEEAPAAEEPAAAEEAPPAEAAEETPETAEETPETEAPAEEKPAEEAAAEETPAEEAEAPPEEPAEEAPAEETASEKPAEPVEPEEPADKA